MGRTVSNVGAKAQRTEPLASETVCEKAGLWGARNKRVSREWGRPHGHVRGLLGIPGVVGVSGCSWKGTFSDLRHHLLFCGERMEGVDVVQREWTDVHSSRPGERAGGWTEAEAVGTGRSGFGRQTQWDAPSDPRGGETGTSRWPSPRV